MSFMKMMVGVKYLNKIMMHFSAAKNYDWKCISGWQISRIHRSDLAW